MRPAFPFRILDFGFRIGWARVLLQGLFGRELEESKIKNSKSKIDQLPFIFAAICGIIFRGTVIAPAM